MSRLGSDDFLIKRPIITAKKATINEQSHTLTFPMVSSASHLTLTLFPNRSLQMISIIFFCFSGTAAGSGLRALFSFLASSFLSSFSLFFFSFFNRFFSYKRKKKDQKDPVDGHWTPRLTFLSSSESFASAKSLSKASSRSIAQQ
jgi:hypothetical protein